MTLILLKEPLDGYHHRRAEKHGWIYFVTHETDSEYPLLNLYEARSLATGVVCTLDPAFTEKVEDAEEL
jgi:hypothetical protein